MKKYSSKWLEFYRTKKGLYVISALIPLATMALVWLLMGVYPFGTKTLMSIDFGQQYISLYQFLKRTVLTGDWSGLFYSFSKSIGGAMIGIWGFNLISPFNLLYILMPTSEFRLAITLTIWLRYAATAIAFSFLLIRRYNGHRNQRRFLVPLLSSVYAMSGLIVAYQMNPIFYDAMIMLPIVVVYLEELIDGGSGWKYSISLMLALFFHFYMGYMISLFIVIYSIYYVLGKEVKLKQLGKPVIRTILYSVFGIGMVMWLLYPIFLNLLISKGAYNNSLQFEWAMQIKPLDILVKFMIGAFDSQSWPAGPNLPNVFIGSLSLFGFGLFFTKQDVRPQQKWAAFGVMFVFFVAMVNVFFNKIWHMGQTPAGFFYRFSWIPSFFMVLLSYRALHNIKAISWRAIALGATFIYLVAEWSYGNEFSFFDLSSSETAINTLMTYLPIVIRVLLVLYAFSALQYKERTKKLQTVGIATVLFIIVTVLTQQNQLISLQTLTIVCWLVTLFILAQGFKQSSYILIVCLTVFELGTNAFIAQNRMGYDNSDHFKDAQLSVLEPINQIRPSKDGEFYRINKTFERSKNDPFMYDYPGLTHFSSNMERSTLSFMTMMGDSGSNASSYYGNGTIFMDAFYGVKYVVDYHDYTGTDVADHPERRFFSRNTTRKDLLDYYTEVWSNDRYVVYENDNILPIAFGVNAATTDVTLHNNQVVANHNAILSAISGNREEIFKTYLFENTDLQNVKVETNEYGKAIYKKIDENQDGVITFKFTPQTNDTYYINAPLAFKRQKGGKIDILLNGKWYEYQHSFDGPQLWNVAHNQQGEEVQFTVRLRETSEADLTDMNMIAANQQLIEPIITERKAQGLQVSSWGNNFIKGTVNITDDSTYMMTSIPYNQGWTVKVDGQEVETKEVWGAFMAFPIKSGEHQVEMTFVPKGWYLGIIVSIVSLLGLIGYAYLERSEERDSLNNAKVI